MKKLNDLFKIMVEKEASDLYLRTNATPRARINGTVEVIDETPLPKAELISITNFLLNNENNKRIYKEKFDIDFIHEEEGVGRFRVNIFTQRGTSAIVARHIHTKVKSFEELNLPVKVLETFGDTDKGLFLVCGPAGNGKSTAIASLIDYINGKSAKHIVTIEDPIEFLFKDNKSLINQRELGIDVPNYPHALRHVTQQSPDIIYIGNIRDEETMRAAVNATELGTFVITTFHTINAVQTIIRILNFFPPHQHDEVRMQLSLILKGTIALRLLPKKDGTGRIPAYETMVVTPTIAHLIKENEIKEIQNFIDSGDLFGMQSFKQSLVNLVKAGQVDVEEARRISDSKDEFDQAMSGLKSRFD